MKKAYLAGVLAAVLLLPTAALAADAAPSLTYVCSLSAEDSDLEAGKWEYLFTSGEETKILLREGEKREFLLCSGVFTAADVKIIKDTAYVPLSVLVEDLGFAVAEEKNGVSLVRDDQKLMVSSKGGTLDTSKMLPLRDIAEALGAEVTYERDGIAPLGNPIISVEFRQTVLTEEEALERAKETLTACLEAERESGWIVQDRVAEDPAVSAAIEKEISEMAFTEDIVAGYYVLEGPGLFLVEKSTGDLYQKTGEGQGGSVSYMETIQKVEMGDTEVFAGYYLG
ncbi:hypothetical protein H9X85_07780 [Anaerotignum lactatifermentans]|uniref:Copper amine oxidase-like N-terminal domain-containing protein n=1 Tax=Anaerotignum lactatifermentans TaxID=160404 RepID=A0ABS2G9E5_9FIRM|nr:hypothetical protein [Anaerotignum lactatifermentans]MBM6829570.1 hypothetical protein [Anaerotignum lactatifermentans]MBM6878064.1 hypothetical protein [Anaerotignum lactatifermentans]MBM6951106.1 hypothetical protein [Anaerotignum lactatifermentans]